MHDAPQTRRELRERAVTSTTATTEAAPEAVSAAPARKQERGVWSTIGMGLMSGLLLLFVGIGILAIAVPAATGATALTVLTSSMEPSLPPGTMVVVRPVVLDDIQPGDVMTYQLRSGEPLLITHRVTQRLHAADGTLRFVTKGDNNAAADPDTVRAEQVRGTVWYVIPYVGWVSNFVTGEARVWLIPLAVGALIVYAAWMYISAARDRIRNRQERAA